MVITASRFQELKANVRLISCREEEAAFEAMLAQEVRNERAKRSAATRKAKHNLCPKCGTDCGYWNLPLCCGK